MSEKNLFLCHGPLFSVNSRRKNWGETKAMGNSLNMCYFVQEKLVLDWLTSRTYSRNDKAICAAAKWLAGSILCFRKF